MVHKCQLARVEKSQAIKWIRVDISEALLILAKQGLADNKLLDLLTVAYGSTEAANKITIQIAESNSGIPADVKSWLKAGGVISTASFWIVRIVISTATCRSAQYPCKKWKYFCSL
jgi:hypothetical protein